jgi:predicted porin
MKFKFAAIALALTAPAAVFAQSSVTVYGVVDADGEYLSGHAKDVRVTSGGLNGSRIGFKGTEDLGSGFYVDFTLEGGLNLDTGSSAQGGALFGRQAFGALRSAQFGSVSAGRQYGSTYIITDQYSAFSNTPVGATTAVIGGYAGGYEPVQGSSATATTLTNATGAETNGSPARVNNSFRYTTPVFAGFSASALAGAGEVTGGTTATRLFDGSVKYSGFGLDAIVAIVSDKAKGAAAASTANVDTIMVAAKYAIDAFHVEGGYVRGDDKRNIAVKQNGTGYWLGGDYRLGASLFKAQWVSNKLDNTTTGYAVAAGNTAKTNAYALGYQYDFSKRTALYTSFARFQNTGVARFASSVPAGLTTAGDLSINQFALGMRHSF